jgi:hypothetical protein
MVIGLVSTLLASRMPVKLWRGLDPALLAKPIKPWICF